MTLTDVRALQVVAPFSETDAAKIRPGQAATVSISALPGQELAAHVIAVDTNATVSSGVVTYNVTFALDNAAPAALKPGMSATVDVITQEQDDVVHVPTAAVHGSGSSATVTVLEKGKQVSVPVTAGITGDSSTAILSGLSAGQTVVLPSVTFSSSSGAGTSTGGAGTGGRGLGGGLGGGGGVVRFGGG